MDCPAAGNAAFYTLKVCWDDANSAYGNLFKDNAALVQGLNDFMAEMCTHQWRYGINAKYYGETNCRANAAAYAPLEATVYGIYKSTTDKATLIKSPTLEREAKGAPLQLDVCQIAAKAVRTLYVSAISKLH